MTLLETIGSTDDLKAMPAEELPELASEIRTFLVDAVSRTGGHLGPNLGVVELTIALHRVFDSPSDVLVFDTGHISYVHKLLTGRQDFSGLRQRGGLSGYPSRAESEHDVMENSHATTSLSWAEGIARGMRLQGVTDRHVVAVIGDGALTGGMAWEAVNNIAADETLPLIMVVNDNERSYAPTIGGLARQLSALRTMPKYEEFLDWSKDRLQRAPLVGRQAYGVVHGMKKGLKDMVAPQGLFEDLGMKYVGPVDGHDEQALEVALRRAKRYGGPVIVHCLTKKGKGYEHARANQDDRFHGIGVINPETGLPLETPGRSWTDVFSDELVGLGEQRQDLVALTAAMLIPVGLRDFQLKFPDRVFDVGIAEQHAVAMAAGLSRAGLHPVVCVYSTFLNRAFDQVLFDVALHQQGVTFVLDRAGVTGADGPSHNGMWDIATFGAVPGLRLIAPRDGEEVARALREAVEVTDAPTVIRFPKARVSEPLPAQRVVGAVEVLHEQGPGDVDTLLVGLGPMAQLAVEVARGLEARGETVRVVDPRWVLPVPEDLLSLAREARRVVTVEDGLVVGGAGSQVAQALSEAGVDVPVRHFGIPREFLAQGSRGQVLAHCGLTAEAMLDSL